MKMTSEQIRLSGALFEELTPELLELATEQERIVLNASIEQLRRMLAVEDYYSYAAYVHGNDWVYCSHQKFLAEALQAFIEADTGHPYDILVISEPPQHGKSRIITETLPSWYLGKYPKKRVISTAYNDDLANKFGRLNRAKIKQFGTELFGVALAKEPNSVSNFMLDNMIGGCLSKGLRSGITGNPADLMVIDDPFKDKADADSLIARNRVWDEWENVLRPRLSPGAKVVVVKTRWHEDGFVGRLIATEGLSGNGGLVTYINLPCEAEENDPLGREVGEPLAPELGKGPEWLKETKAAFLNGTSEGGPSAWYALYQGRPRILAGNMFKEGWFEFWFPRSTEKPRPWAVRMPDGNMGAKDPRPLPIRFDEIVQAWDCTFKDEITSDFVVGTVWGRYGIDYYLLDMVRRRMDIIDTMDAIEAMSRKWPDARLKLIEDKANGPAVIKLLRNRVSGLVPVPVSKSKAGRAQATQPAFESGHVFIPHPTIHSWSLYVIDEFTGFPNAKNDDIVDSCVHALNRFDDNTANQTRINGQEVAGYGHIYKPMFGQKPTHRVAKGRARVV
jgi:predicted phage terminase large subunit-like protein